MMRKSSGPSPIKHPSKVRYRNSQRMSRISIFHLIPVVFGDLILLVIHLSSETRSFPRSHAYNRNFTASLLTKGMRAMLGNCPKMLMFIAIEKWVYIDNNFSSSSHRNPSWLSVSCPIARIHFLIWIPSLPCSPLTEECAPSTGFLFKQVTQKKIWELISHWFSYSLIWREGVRKK